MKQVPNSAATPAGQGGEACSEYMQTAAVETARRSFEKELRDLEQMAKKRARKLVFEGDGQDRNNPNESALDYEGCMKGVEMMLEEFGEDVSELVTADAMEKLHTQVSVSVLQPKLYKMLGMKNQLGTLDVKKVYSEKVAKLKSDRQILKRADQSWNKRYWSLQRML